MSTFFTPVFGVPAGITLVRFHLETADTSYLHPVPFDKRLGHVIKNRIDDLSGGSKVCDIFKLG